MTPMRWGIATAVALGLAATATPAFAGTYNVAACNAPGGHGVNNSWDWAVQTLANAPTADDLANYQLGGSCAGPNGLEATPVPGRRARWGSFAQFSFTPPSGTVITRVRLWRHAIAYLPSDDPNTPENDSGRWEVYAFFGNGNQIGAESCKPGAGPTPNPCEVGSQGFSRNSLDDTAGRGDGFTAGIFCGGDNGPLLLCRNGPPSALYQFQGAIVTLQDSAPPTMTAGGSLLSDAWRRSSDTVSYKASDNTGIRVARIELDGKGVGIDNRACDFTRKVPCSDVSAGTVRIAEPVVDGFHSLRFIVADAANNTAVVSRRVAIDDNAPSASWERPRGNTIAIAVADEASGVAGGQILVRNSSAEPFRPLPTSLTNGLLTAPLDRGTPSTTDVRVSVSDLVGNTATGAPPILRLTSARIGRRKHSIRESRVKIPYGRSALVRGRLTLSAGQPVAGVRISVSGTTRLADATAQLIGTTTTSSRGGFSFRVPPGPSRTLHFVSDASGDALRGARGLGAPVPASSTIHAARTRVSGDVLVRFAGTVQHGRQPIPRTGLVVVLQGFVRGHWQTFADSRTNSRGRWRARYRFVGRPGSYPIRVRIPRQNGFPFDLGYSRVVRVGVR